jgi:putative ABC transport system permease protein
MKTHDEWGWAWLETLLQDLRFGARMLRKSPGLSTVAVLTLALGIGANAGVFSVVNTLLLRSLPFREPDRLTLLQNFVPPHDTVAQFHDWRRQRQYFADAAVFEDIDANLHGGRGVIRAHVAQTSWNFFSVLGTQLMLGDGFAPDDDVDFARASGQGLPGRNAVAVIGYGLWQELFGGSPKALGATIRVQGHPLTVIGVAPPGFDYPNKTIVWKPGTFNRGNDGWVVVGRLKSGISLARAQAQFAAEASPERPGGNNLDLPPKMISLRDSLLGLFKDASLMLMSAVGLVLLIACTNLAGLLMARTAERAAELSVRGAVGASGSRLARQLLRTQSLETMP